MAFVRSTRCELGNKQAYEQRAGTSNRSSRHSIRGAFQNEQNDEITIDRNVLEKFEVFDLSDPLAAPN